MNNSNWPNTNTLLSCLMLRPALPHLANTLHRALAMPHERQHHELRTYNTAPPQPYATCLQRQQGDLRVYPR